MEPLTNSNNASTTAGLTTNTPPSNYFWKNLKFIIPAVFICLIFIVLNLNYLRIISFGWLPQNNLCSALPPTQTQSKKIVDEATLSIPYPILQNSMVYEWRGSVEGTLISKTNSSITLSKNNQTVNIIIKAGNNGTKFSFQIDPSDKNAAQKPPEYISLEQIPLGRWLVGDFFVLSHDDKLYGSSFLIMAEGYAKNKN